MDNSDSGYVTLGILSTTSPSTTTPEQTMNVYFGTEMPNLSQDLSVTIVI
ncbi:MAG TPA: hypothetical protein VMD05_05080 [Candidatus Nanoarchaeia archaeon]|nr:hypothetical protein [Candidatus Nanoarchaeia archaeon]